MVPNQSDSTLIDLTSGRESPLKNFPHGCKYSTGEALKVWTMGREIVVDDDREKESI